MQEPVFEKGYPDYDAVNDLKPKDRALRIHKSVTARERRKEAKDIIETRTTNEYNKLRKQRRNKK
jgi:hypothetical protein